MNTQLFEKITTFAFDVDGVMTDGGLTLLPGGLQARTMNVKDGFAIEHAVKSGFNIVIISKGRSDEVVDRLSRLGVKHIYMEQFHKLDKLKSFLEEQHIDMDQVAYTGDDIPDMDCLKAAGLACCPWDAVEEVKAIADYISPVKGGRGVVRDIMKKVLASQGKWNFK